MRQTDQAVRKNGYRKIYLIYLKRVKNFVFTNSGHETIFNPESVINQKCNT